MTNKTVVAKVAGAFGKKTPNALLEDALSVFSKAVAGVNAAQAEIQVLEAEKAVQIAKLQAELVEAQEAIAKLDRVKGRLIDITA